MCSRPNKSEEYSLNELIFDALSQLQVLRYNPRSIRRYQTVWRKLVIFAQQKGHEGQLQEQLIADFLTHHQINPEISTENCKGWKKHATYALTQLWHFARSGVTA